MAAKAAAAAVAVHMEAVVVVARLYSATLAFHQMGTPGLVFGVAWQLERRAVAAPQIAGYDAGAGEHHHSLLDAHSFRFCAACVVI